jgi:hypothetical protein
MSNISYGTSTNFTTTTACNSLGSGSSASFGVIDNTTALALDYLVEISATSGASVAGTQTVDIFATDSVDGTNFSDSASVNNMAKIGSIFFSGASVTVRSRGMSIAQYFGGVMPPKVTIYAVNNTGAQLAATGSAGQYRGATVA